VGLRESGGPNARAHREAPPASAGRATAHILGLQRSAGNRAVTSRIKSVQRAGGWSDADQKPGKDIAESDPKTGWNVEEHAVGTIRRIPLDGLTGGLQSNPGESGSARKLSNESVAGPVKGPARSDPGEQKGRGRAIALVPADIDASAPVEVFFHLHGNTENESRGFAGWREHRKSHEVRDVARDHIEQQIEAAKSAQIVGILPQGVNSSSFGQISPDAYITDAFDRLAEIGAWAKPPPRFSVVLSAHSGGGFTIGRMMKGAKGFRLPAHLKTLVLFESMHARLTGPPERRFDQVKDFASWIESNLGALMAVLNDPAVSAEDKQARLHDATQVRLYWDPNGSYNDAYTRMGGLIDKWFHDNERALGPNYQALRDLVVFVKKPRVGHEGMVRSGITESLMARSGAGAPAPPAPSSGGRAHKFALDGDGITPDLVAAQAGTNGQSASAAFVHATAGGSAPLPAAASALSASGLGTENELTDALFALVHPERGGQHIGAEHPELARDWRTLRHEYARPALGASHAATQVPTSAAPPTAEAVPAVDAATIKPAKAATGAKHMTDDEKQKALANALKQVTTVGSAPVRATIADMLRYNGVADEDTWWSGMVFNATFLDIPIQPSGGSVPGVHSELHERLVKAENKLLARFPGLTKAQIASKMKIYEVSGVRPPKNATGRNSPSHHCFGLAIDINHPTNPFLGNDKPKKPKPQHNRPVPPEEVAKYDATMQNRSPRIVERAMLLLRGEKFNVEAAIAVPRGPGSEAGRLWEIHHRASETLAEYLRLADDLNGETLKDLVDARRHGGDDRDLNYWRQRIAEDRANIKHWDFEHHKAPETGGYMDLKKELVEALVDEGQLLWGGSYVGAKDMMHFDWRRGTIKRNLPTGWKPSAH
jgi:hypothetical protein